ncbi:S9 family peptidase [Ancylomarina euxinus]|uniref:S9 family peptidase n=1 Tax=Ancylomarina euxinus TaxID=2283627 RepID=A0A425XYX6_9BACT|nr:S9 family peptidase [Ancylomarina euxinus]MCZ4695541.1 S9 family peptidase [Ancylomarina euxinus]MUP15922.1 prolyl oligopeptidase family serine peptidase [Ancylomarina euxinus]RRG20364.1 S9 family peptidase [Ancylomarina euxinus]
MRISTTYLCVPVLAIFIFACTAIETKVERPLKIALEDFFKNPQKTSYRISPEGTKFSYRAPFEDRMNIFIQEIGSQEAVQITFEKDRDIAAYFWANDNRILYLKDSGGDENFKLYGVDIDGKNQVCFTDFEKVRTGIIDRLDAIPDEIIISMNKRDPRVFDPYRLNIVTGELTMLYKNPGNISGWMTDHEGKLRVATAVTDMINTTVLYRETEKDEFKPIITTSFKETMSPHFFTFDNKKLYASSNLGRDKMEIVIFDPATGKETETLFANDMVDVESLSYSKKRKVLTMAEYTTDMVNFKFFDKESEDMYNRVKSELSAYDCYFTSTNKDEDKFLIRTYSDKSLGAYYFYDKNTDELTLINAVSPWMDESQMAAMKPIKYTSRDGKTIHGYLTLPIGLDAKNLPLVVNPHGGPWARDRWGFNPEIQFLANRGYAVLQMNFRGSTGYGREFWESSFKQWGQKMQDDITDAVQWAITEGYADKDRIAIYGGSYGGYATLAGLAFTPDLYKCGVDYVGVSNMFTFMNTIPPYWEPYRQMFYEMAGDPVKDSVMMAKISPALHADKIKAPLFVAQGANDPRVNLAESDQMVAAMKARGINVEYMVKDNEGHGFRNQENRFEFYRAMEKFLNANMMNQE